MAVMISPANPRSPLGSPARRIALAPNSSTRGMQEEPAATGCERARRRRGRRAPPRSHRPRRRGSRAVRAVSGPARSGGSRDAGRALPAARAPARARYSGPRSPSTTSSRWRAWGWSTRSIASTSRREVAFSSYAVPTILGEIKRYFRDRTWSVRVPRDLQELALGSSGGPSCRPTCSASRRSTRSRPRSAPRRRRPRGARGVGRLPRDSLDAAARQRRRRRRHARRHRRHAEDGLRPRRGPRDARPPMRVAHAARARGRAPALRGGPHPGRDRRAHRRLADAGLAHPAPGARPPALVRDGAGARDRLCRGCPRANHMTPSLGDGNDDAPSSAAPR